MYNPLLEYFYEVIEVSSNSDSQADDEAGDEERVREEEEEEEEDDVSQGEESDELPIYSLPCKTVMSRSLNPQNAKSAELATKDDSVTESESDHVTTTPPRSTRNIRNALPAPKQKVKNDDSSVTEPESGDDPPEPPQNLAEDSATELEPDDKLAKSSLIHTGSTHLAAVQSAAEPLILDYRTQTRVPPSLNKYLRDYQRAGVRFLLERYRLACGAVLGDDMGLGKTIQIIAFLSAIMHKIGTPADIGRRKKYVDEDVMERKEWKDRREVPPADERWATALVVAPSSVVGVWDREFSKWGYFEVGVYTGTHEEREQILRDFKLGRLDVVITSFDLARRHIDSLNSLPWSVLVIDEAHRLKNPRSSSAKAFSSFCYPETHTIPVHASLLSQHPPRGPTLPKAVERAGPTRIALTGTAIQNSYAELWTLLDWVNPGSVGTLKQWTKIVTGPLAAGQAKGCGEDVRIKAAQVAEALRDRLLPKFFLRRTKEIIKDQLPKKVDNVVFCPLAATQAEVYKKILASEPVQNMVRKDEECECGSKLKRKACCHKVDAGDLFKYMSTLIKISNHLALILPSPADTPEQTARNRELAEIAFGDGMSPKYGQAMLKPEYCGKWIVLQTLLSEWRQTPSNKVLIFTKSVKLLDMLEFHLKGQHYRFEKLEGATRPADRMAAIDKFQEDPDVFVFLISTLAGGTGLNLTAANKVVVFDPNWNPAHDLQAMDRAYRFGQTRDVDVYRFLGAGSIEELIYARQVYKQQQMAIGYEASVQTRYFSGVSGDKNQQGELFGLQNIFKLHENTSMTEMSIEKASLTNLDWALKNMDAVHSKTTGRKGWVYEAEEREIKDDGELKGLGALLFDDGIPATKPDHVQRILDASGIKYKHRNDELLAPSHIEKARVKSAIEERKKRAKQEKRRKKARADQPLDFEWPPKRRRETSTQKLAARQRALIDLGYVQSPADLATFAQTFEKKSEQDQMEILARLDEYARATKR
ncbi:P-loop containing nucleoside triphosphate hydrolase protein [Vararia minispora EC-137]|uniref:P-loop containing nucleoside triphosphate hydrolase protein n=1 Tax=Vararia minispora EC-137 TaxID=1314806 RepID=A0ACB8QH09_9AGAM|nr:P-loop containing nucleoside triphosphate hydrolase protein [Vararia minispora EC-137]